MHDSRGARRSTWGLLGLTLLLAACGPSRRERAIGALTPGHIAAATAPAPGARPPLRFRVYADAEWQAQKGDWQAAAEAMVEQASGVALFEFGVGFVAERIAPWPITTRGDRLEDRLEALVRHDPGEDGVWIVGLVGGVPVTSSTFEHIGMAHMPGRHFVMRSMADVAEADAIGGISALDDADRRRLLGQRAAHRRAVVFLHEWGHTLGALHARDFDVIMAPSYASRTKGFGPAALGVGRAVLAVEPTPGASPREWLAARRDAAAAWYRDNPGAAVDAIDRERFLSGQAPAAPPEAPGAADRGMSRDEVKAAMDAGRVSALVTAAAHAEPAAQQQVTDWARMTRRRFAMPEGFPAADEADYVAAQRAVDAALGAADMAAAEERIAALEARWPDAAAGPQMRCDLLGRQGRFDDALRACRAATERYDESVGAWLMMGMIALHTQRPREAVPMLERVVELDPLQAPAWVYLGRTYTALGRAADREALEARFTATTGRPFPE